MKCMPVLPAQEIKEQMAFYEALGFEVVTYLTRPMPYGIVQYEQLTFHTYGSKKHDPKNNPMMTFVEIEDLETLEALNGEFTRNLKVTYGRIPRSGLPRISKVNELKEDHRFTMTDVGGNHLYFIAAKKEHEVEFFRELENEDVRKMYQLSYDFLYSKMDKRAAKAALLKLDEQLQEQRVTPLDNVKIALVKLSFGENVSEQKQTIEDWLSTNLHAKERSRIHRRYQSILSE